MSDPLDSGMSLDNIDLCLPNRVNAVKPTLIPAPHCRRLSCRAQTFWDTKGNALIVTVNGERYPDHNDQSECEKIQSICEPRFTINPLPHRWAYWAVPVTVHIVSVLSIHWCVNLTVLSS